MTDGGLKANSFAITLTANDADKTIRFYTDALGFEIAEKFEQDGKIIGGMLGAGSAQLGISQDDFKKGRDRTKGVGMGIWIETPQDLKALAKRAQGAGVKLEQDVGPLPWGQIAFIVKDPDGFKVTIANPR